jgi:hypothetical protein
MKIVWTTANTVYKGVGERPEVVQGGTTSSEYAVCIYEISMVQFPCVINDKAFGTRSLFSYLRALKFT